MDRREFLRRALTLAPALVAVPPVVKYFLPPPGGWARFSGYDFVLWGETTLEAIFDRDIRRIMREAYKRSMDRIVNPPLIERIDMHAAARQFAEASMPSLTIPARAWFTLDPARG